jgi:N-acetylglucosamine-6-phosphate deacetylase
VLTMDAAFRVLVRQVGMSLVDAAWICATTPARQLGLSEGGALAAGALADLVVFDADLNVQGTYLAGRLWRNTAQVPLV